MLPGCYRALGYLALHYIVLGKPLKWTTINCWRQFIVTNLCGDNSLGFTLLTVDSSLSHFKDSQYCISIFLLCWLARALVVGSVGDNNSCGELHVSTLLLLVVITLQVGKAQSSHTKYKVRQLLIHYHFNEENRLLLLFKWISGWRTKMHF